MRRTKQKPAPRRIPVRGRSGAGSGQDVFLTVEEAARRIKAGRMVIVVDDAERENEGDLVFAAEKATPGMVNFAVKLGRGILCARCPPTSPTTWVSSSW